MFSRMPGYLISNYDPQDFGAQDFIVDAGPAFLPPSGMSYVICQYLPSTRFSAPVATTPNYEITKSLLDE
jgi:hypothetical protein